MPRHFQPFIADLDADLVVTISNLRSLRADVSGWIAAASDDADIIETKTKPGSSALPAKAVSELEAQLGGLGAGLGGAVAYRRAVTLASSQSTPTMEGLRRSDASRRRVLKREGLYTAIDSLPVLALEPK